MAAEHSQLLAQWPGTLSQILSGIQQAAQSVLGIYLKLTSLHDTSESSTLGGLNYAVYKSTHSLTVFTVFSEKYFVVLENITIRCVSSMEMLSVLWCQ